MNTQCQGCGATDLITTYEEGFIVCGNCGQVNDRVWSFEPECRWFDEEERRLRDRAGDPSSLLTMALLGLPTSTFTTRSDYLGTTMECQQQVKFERLLAYQRSAKQSRKRHFTRIREEIKNICHQLQLPESMVQDVLTLYVKTSQKDFIRGRSKLQVILALIFIVSMKKGITMDLNSIAQYWDLEPRKIRKMVAAIQQLLHIEIKPRWPTETKELILQLGTQLKLTPEIIETALDIHTIARKNDKEHLLDGKRPSSIAAACIYLACLARKERILLDHMAKKMKITKLTLRKRSQLIARIIKDAGNTRLQLAM